VYQLVILQKQINALNKQTTTMLESIRQARENSESEMGEF
jgi:hypothetical protein